MDSECKHTPQPGDAQTEGKLPYEAPALTVHGTLDTLTRGGNKGVADGLTGSIIAA